MIGFIVFAFPCLRGGTLQPAGYYYEYKRVPLFAGGNREAGTKHYRCQSPKSGRARQKRGVLAKKECDDKRALLGCVYF
jgi:hypothetical protein